MAHSSDYSKIYTDSTSGISCYDVSRCLGESTLDVGSLCQSTKINKWAKRKPVNQPYFRALTANGTQDEWKGTPGDNTQGYYYGVKMAADALDLADLLNVTFAYDRGPSGGSVSPFRLLDFDGYDHNALPTVSGFIEAIYYNADRSFQITISVDTTGWNTSGIDINDVLGGTSTLADLYPCIIIRNIETGVTWAKALMESATGQPGKLYGEDRWRQSWNLSDLSNVGLEEGEPLISTGTHNYLVTVFLSQYIDQQHTMPLDDWLYVGTGFATTGKVCAVPAASAQTITLKRYISGYAPFVPSAQISRATTTGFALEVAVVPVVQEGDTAVVSVTIGDETEEVSIYEGTSSGSASFTWNEIGILVMSGQTVSVEVTLVCGRNSQTTTMTYTIV